MGNNISDFSLFSVCSGDDSFRDDMTLSSDGTADKGLFARGSDVVPRCEGVDDSQVSVTAAGEQTTRESTDVEPVDKEMPEPTSQQAAFQVLSEEGGKRTVTRRTAMGTFITEEQDIPADAPAIGTEAQNRASAAMMDQLDASFSMRS